ncbi:MAG: HAMP domain-containing sensor histidine kinase, partial [Xanthomonadales bacterium]|nr:HAMP domain-containing sensor histidine kinase [Xanthomonadales bacterium]
YRVELAWAPLPNRVRVAIGVTDAQAGAPPVQRGMLQNGRPQAWLELVSPAQELERVLARAVVDPATRAWAVDEHGWVWAASGAPPGEAPSESRWAQRWLYRLLAGGAIPEGQPRPASAWRLDDALVERALAGQEASAWVREPDTARVFHSVAVPVPGDQRPRRALLLESATEGLLLTANRALGRVLLTTLAAMLLLAGGLWWFATRLSRRVQRLSSAVSDAMDERGRTNPIPLTGDADELGELARNNARLLRAVNEYTAYLEKLAGRLSHELQTPLAITRSSLDNLQDLPPEAERYLARAREGLDRQAAIVRAMSEASRLEAAVAGADWVEVDLAALLATAAEGYRAAYPGREVAFDGGGSCPLTCAPDLVAQALDKLVHNAVTCSGPQDTVTLALEADDETCTLHVRNAGSRLPDVMTEQLFDSLVTLRERPGDGTHLGLGLHIVKLVMDAHGGTASARNLPDGRGVEFSLEFPRDGGPGTRDASG